MTRRITGEHQNRVVVVAVRRVYGRVERARRSVLKMVRPTHELHPDGVRARGIAVQQFVQRVERIAAVHLQRLVHVRLRRRVVRTDQLLHKVSVFIVVVHTFSIHDHVATVWLNPFDEFVCGIGGVRNRTRFDGERRVREQLTHRSHRVHNVLHTRGCWWRRVRWLVHVIE